MRSTRAFPIVISGPSGVGKTTLVGTLTGRVDGLRRSVSATTRPRRPGEVDGKSYYFVEPEEFERLKRGKLIEWAEVHGHLYGTPRGFIEETLGSGVDVLLNIDVQGGKQVKKCFPDAVMIFILPPSFEALEQRITHRAADHSEAIKTRLHNARQEMTAVPDYEYVIVNDTVDQAVAEMAAVIVSERTRRTRYPEIFFKTFNP